MWAYLCGAIAAGPLLGDRWIYVVGGVILGGPLICGTSQAVNDWFDRHVDAINEPDRVIPSGRMPGSWGLYVAILGSLLSLLFASALGTWVFVAAIFGLALAWAYSAPPLRFKQNGWLGNATVGFAYESIPWVTAMTAALGTLPNSEALIVAFLYGVGAHGIMTLNDFKAIKGDREMGVRTLPVIHGVQNAARIACLMMALPQAFVIGLLSLWGQPFYAVLIALFLVVQAISMVRFLSNPIKFAVWYSALGVGLYVSGMMISAFGLRSIGS